MRETNPLNLMRELPAEARDNKWIGVRRSDSTCALRIKVGRPLSRIETRHEAVARANVLKKRPVQLFLEWAYEKVGAISSMGLNFFLPRWPTRPHFFVMEVAHEILVFSDS